MTRARQIPGIIRVPRVGFGVPPKRIFCDVWSEMRAPFRQHIAGSSRKRDAFANTRDAYAPRTLLLAALLLFAAFSHSWAVDPDVASSLVSYQYLDSLADPPGQPNVVSPLVSYQYLDWPGDENITFQSSANVSYFFSGGVSLTITGDVRTPAGVPVSGAAITLKRFGAPFWTEVSAANGTFAGSNLLAANYVLVVTKAGYGTHVSNYAGMAGGNQSLNIILEPLPAAPTATTVNRALGPNEVRPAPMPGDPDAPVLRLFSGTSFVTDLSGIQTNRMTVVLAHGWVPTVGGDFATALDWATSLAYLIQSRHPGVAQAPNILVWDWREKAQAALPPIDEPAEQGIELGKALHAALGASYSQHVHFVGHSLGAIVNRYACDYAHKSLVGRHIRDNPAIGWPEASTEPHFTMLDEAEIASVFGENVLTAAAIGWKIAQIKGAIVAGAISAKADWKYPIPKDALWVDNYVSAFGFQRGDAVNVCLPAQAFASGDPIASHSYAHEFYRNTVNPTGPPAPVGYRLSLESAGDFPPTGIGMSAGSLWYENLGTTGDILDMTLATDPLDYECSLGILSTFVIVGSQDGLDAIGQSVLNGYEAGIEWAGEIGGTAIYKTDQVVTETTEKVGLWWDAQMDKAANVLDSIDPELLITGPLTKPVFRLKLRTVPLPPSPGLLAASGGQPAYAWVTVTVPANAGLMAFDFTVTGDPVDDRIACAVNGQNLFTLPAKFAAEGEPMSTDLMDVSAYAGQTIEVFFGLAGGTSTDCEVAIDGLRFITVPMPKVAIAREGANAQVKWPAAATGWLLESSDTLAPGSWQPVPMTGTTLFGGVATLDQPLVGPRKFYRLRRNP